MKKKIFDRDVDECSLKVIEILKEYNCYVVYDEELDKVIIVDKDTAEFCDGIH